MISLLFFALASVCNSVMDTLKDKYHKSIFFRLNANPKFWNEAIAWENKYIGFKQVNGHRKIKGTNINYPDSLTSGWHVFKMVMVILLACSAIFAYEFGLPFGFIKNIWIRIPVTLIALGLFWNLPFNLFYNKILVKK